jgi:hypothetical protein
MIGFPGRIFDGEGAPMDGKKADLTQDRLDACEHRSLVQTERAPRSPDGAAPVAWVWLMDDEAAFATVPQPIINAAITLMMDGSGVLILANLPEVGADIRDGLLRALELAQAPDDAAGHA